MQNKNNRRKMNLASNRDYNHGAIIRIRSYKQVAVAPKRT